jgi:hypothetical protein
VSVTLERQLAESTVDGVLNLASQGQLDYLLVDQQMAGIIREQESDHAVFWNLSTSVFDEDPSGFAFDHIGPVISQAARDFAQRIKEHVDAYPIDDGHGGYRTTAEIDSPK